jgi:virulence-associated protein VapD
MDEVAASVSLPASPRKHYVIAFDLDTKKLKNMVGGQYNNCYLQIAVALRNHGFNKTQGSVYESRYCTKKQLVAAMESLLDFAWFPPCKRDFVAYEVANSHSFDDILDMGAAND